MWGQRDRAKRFPVVIDEENILLFFEFYRARLAMELTGTPPRPFQPRVSFDTFDNKDARDFSLTLNCKHKDYRYSRRSRTFLCGTDQNDYSEFALEWLIDELVDDGDEIVCLRVVDKDSKISSEASVEEGRYRREAQKLLDQIIEKNTDDKAINLILEFAVGKVPDTIQRMVRMPWFLFLSDLFPQGRFSPRITPNSADITVALFFYLRGGPAENSFVFSGRSLSMSRPF